MDGFFRLSVASALAFAAGLSLFAERQPYARYQSIVDRQMFGALPPGFDPTKSPSEVSKADAREAEAQLTKEQEQIKSAIHFSMINITPSGDTAVGFTDNGDAKNPVHYYLKVGEQRNGWLVKEADPVKATMTIAKGDVEVSLSIGGNSAKGGATTKAGGASPSVASATAEQQSAASRPTSLLGARPAAANSLGSLRSRRLLREQQRQQDAAEKEAAQAAAEERRREEEARREEERLQREVEREEQRAQLQQITEELRKAREERAAAQENPPAPPDDEPPPPPEDE